MYGKIVDNEFVKLGPVVSINGTLVNSESAAAAEWRTTNGFKPVVGGTPSCASCTECGGPTDGVCPRGKVACWSGYTDGATQITETSVFRTIAEADAQSVARAITANEIADMNTDAKRNAVIAKLAAYVVKTGAAVALLASFDAFGGILVETAVKGEITDDASIVTAVTETEGTRSWNRERLWEIGYEAVPTESESSAPVISTNENYQVLSNYTTSLTYTLAANCYQMPLDEYATSIAPVAEWGCLTAGGSITSGGRLTATNAGTYRVSAKSVDAVQYVDVAISADRRETKSIDRYVDDGSAVRKAVNDDALAALNAAQLVESNLVDGVWYYTYSTPTYKMTTVDASGQFAPFAISQRILATAAHYSGGIPMGTQTFSDGTTTVVMRKREGVRLSDWAVTNGWTEAEVKAIAGLTDIMMVRCTSDIGLNIPDGCIPYLMNADTRRRHFGESMVGVQVWQAYPYVQYATPLTMTGDCSWSINTSYQGYAREDVKARRDAMGQLVWPKSNLSGRPVWYTANGTNVIVSHTYTTQGGADWATAFPIIKAFVEAYGDTIKEFK